MCRAWSLELEKKRVKPTRCGSRKLEFARELKETAAFRAGFHHCRRSEFDSVALLFAHHQEAHSVYARACERVRARRHASIHALGFRRV